MREFRIDYVNEREGYNSVHYRDKFYNTISHFHSKVHNYSIKKYYNIDYNDFGIMLNIYKKLKKK